MPTILRIDGYRFFFFSLEGNEPPHIHIEHGDKVAKFWLNPVNLACSTAFRSQELTEIRALVVKYGLKNLWRNGMSISAVKFDDHAIDVSFKKDALHFVLADGREISAPLEWFPRLRDASEQDRNQWRLIGHGVGVNWPTIDEDIAVRTLMHGKE